MRLNLWTKLNVNPLSKIFWKDYVLVTSLDIWQFSLLRAIINLNFSPSHPSSSTSDFVWGRRRVHRLQLSLFRTFRSAIIDIGLCLRSSSSSSLTVVALQNFSLSHFRHRTLSEVVVVEFIAYSCRFSELFRSVIFDIGFYPGSSACPSLVLSF